MLSRLCRRLGIHRHHWVAWSETDRELGWHFDYLKCDAPGCKWAGLTWVQKERIR